MMKLMIKKFVLGYISRREPDLLIGPKGDPYMKRWYFLPRNRILNVYFHEFHHSDDDRALHDHPWWSLSLLCQDNLIEVLKISEGITQTHFIPEGTWTLRSAEYAHRLIVRKHERPVTLFITGPKMRVWGFHCPSGWIDFRKFHSDGGCGES